MHDGIALEGGPCPALLLSGDVLRYSGENSLDLVSSISFVFPLEKRPRQALPPPPFLQQAQFHLPPLVNNIRPLKKRQPKSETAFQVVPGVCFEEGVKVAECLGFFVRLHGGLEVGDVFRQLGLREGVRS